MVLLYHITGIDPIAKSDLQAKGDHVMSIYVCALCGYEYHASIGDPEQGIEAETEFEELPANWVCPLCGATKDDFEKMGTDEDEID